MKSNITRIKSKKKTKKIVCLTAYSKSFAKILDKYCDIILVGDSLANVLYGMSNTHKISLDTMIKHATSVKMGCKKALCIVDMPKGTYKNKRKALENARKIIKITKCDAVKIESNFKNNSIIKYLVDHKVAVMGHIGFTPQFHKKFKTVGVSLNEKIKLVKEAVNIEKAGAFSLVLECIATGTSKEITKTLNIPTIGIGSSVYCDGQILVTDDLLGLSGFYPKFVKKYINLNKIIEKAIQKYKKEVTEKIFPNKKNSF